MGDHMRSLVAGDNLSHTVGEFPVDKPLRLLLVVATAIAALYSSVSLAEDGSGLALEDCRISAGPGRPGINARCGTLVRPENPADPASPTLDLHVAVVPALSLDQKMDPLVPIAGGPGQASTVFYASYAGAFEHIRRHRDIVLIDQRGTGKSAPMVCDSDDDILESQYSEELVKELTQECLDNLPHDPRYFTTSVAVEDLEALRIALGYEQFNVYGISYGSRVAQHYLRRFPTSTRSVILDGVTAPQISLGPGIAIDAQNVMNAILDRCLADPGCAERFPDIRTKLSELVSRLQQQSFDVSLPHPLTGEIEELAFSNFELAAALRLLSYHPSFVALLPLFIQQAYDGNYTPLAAQFLMISTNLEEALNLGMHNAVVCTEDGPYYDDMEIDFDALKATYMGEFQYLNLKTICSVWPAGVIDEGFKQPVSTDVPVLLLSGDLDPVTPPEYAEQAAINLTNSLHLVGQHQGHGQAMRGCFPTVMAQFIDQASVEALETECLERLHSMPFFLDHAGPQP